MLKKRTLDDLDTKFHSKLYTQNYSKQKILEGVKIVELSMNISEEGYLVELIRNDKNGELVGFPGFKLAQVNRVKMYPGTIKAWHLHLKQDEIWCVTPGSHLLVGLWDLRRDSATCGASMRLSLGEGKTQLLYIPTGVAHGSAIISGNKVEMLYFVNETFNVDDPDELRLPWDSLGNDFWLPERD